MQHRLLGRVGFGGFFAGEGEGAGAEWMGVLRDENFAGEEGA